MSSIRFICHFCRRPLKLARSSEASGPDLRREPAASNFPSARGDPGGPREEDLQGSASGGTFPGDGQMPWLGPGHFTLLGKLACARSLGSIHAAMTGLGDVLSGEDGLEHPLCEDCTDSLLERLDAQLSLSGLDSQTYKRCLESGGDGPGEDARETLQRELRVLEREEARLAQELEELEEDRARAAEALQAARAETGALEQRARQHPGELSELQWQQLELQDELCSLEDRLRYAQAQLARLQKSNAFKAAFAIGCDGPLAVINGFRLGCGPAAAPVSWREINAAWGQTALLLGALASTVGLQFQRYRLVPRGDHSCLRPLAERAPELPLFCTWGRGSPPHGAFDRAMLAFLDCMQQFKEEAGKAEPALCMPHRIHAEQGLLEDPGSRELYSIRTRGNREERWTKALKLMLTNFKWSLDWVSLRYRHK